MSQPVLELNQVTVAFPGPDGWRTVVDQVSLTVAPGQRVGLVGESGSGKSLTALAALGLVPEPGELRSGSIRAGAIEVQSAEAAALQEVRGSVIGLVLQEPATALNPVLSIGFQLVETIRCHRRLGSRQARREALGLLAELSLPEPEALLDAYPHQLSGGQLQRVMLALALAGKPRIIIADEPTTALDVTTQAQVLDLLRRICAQQKIGLLLITHDLAVVAATVDDLEVMYAGEIVESGPVAELFTNALHPYTRMLLSATPGRDQGLGPDHPAEPVEGLRSSPTHPEAVNAGPGGSGCHFAGRCPIVQPACRSQHPQLVALDSGRRLRCPIARIAAAAADASNG